MIFKNVHEKKTKSSITQFSKQPYTSEFSEYIYHKVSSQFKKIAKKSCWVLQPFSVYKARFRKIFQIFFT